jgi:hypothetical protein
VGCQTVGTLCISVGEKTPRELDLADVCASTWEPGRVYENGVRVRPASKPSGFEYVSTAGQSAHREPKWPLTIDASIIDGSVTWTAKAISNASLSRTIATAVWTAPVGITISNQSLINTNGAQRTKAYIQGDGAGNYEVSALVTFSDGSVEQYIIEAAVV